MKLRDNHEKPCETPVADKPSLRRKKSATHSVSATEADTPKVCTTILSMIKKVVS